LYCENYAGGRYTLVGDGNPFTRETPKVRRNRVADAGGYERTFISTWEARASKPCKLTIEETAAVDVQERQPREHVPSLKVLITVRCSSRLSACSTQPVAAPIEVWFIGAALPGSGTSHVTAYCH
jgi:hypothetical protein